MVLGALGLLDVVSEAKPRTGRTEPIGEGLVQMEFLCASYKVASWLVIISSTYRVHESI